MSPTPTIAIVGAGAIGAYYGSRLAQHGRSVHFLLRSDYDTVRQKGWDVRSIDGDFHLPPDRFHAHNDPRSMPRADLVVVTLKSTASDQYETLIRPLLGPDTAILPLQNGLGTEEALADRFGAERIIGGLAYICCTRVAPGVVEHTCEGRIQISDFTAGPSERAGRVAELFNASLVKCQVLPDLRAGKWRKLVWNVPFNGLGALLDRSTDQLLATPEGVQSVSALMHEIIATANAMGLEVPEDLARQMIPFTHKMGRYRTSMQIDRKQGRPMEIEPIIGEPLRAARELGVPTPHLAALYESLSKLNALALHPAAPHR